jgi:peptide deformylase
MASRPRRGEESETIVPLEIAQLGQPALWQVASEVPPEQIARQPFVELLRDMMETLRLHKGAGLAAPQVFASLRVFLAAVAAPEEENATPAFDVFINPKITPLTDETVRAWEGCLSFPELLVLVPRYRAVRIEYLDAAGEARVRDLQGFPARVVQHEFDHLEGILTIDRAESPRHIIKASEIDDVIEAMK